MKFLKCLPECSKAGVDARMDIQGLVSASSTWWNLLDAAWMKQLTPLYTNEKCPTRAETLDFWTRFWKFRGSVLNHFPPPWFFWTQQSLQERPTALRGSYQSSRTRLGPTFSVMFARSAKDSRFFTISTLRNRHVRVWISYPNIS